MQMRLNADGSESVPYDNPVFPFYIRPGFLSSYDNFSALSHWHDDIELIYVQEGHMWYNVSGQIIRLEAGEGIFVNSRQLHYGFSKDYQECTFLCLVIHPSLLSASSYLDKAFVSPLLGSASLPYCLLRANVPWQRNMMACILEAASLYGSAAPEYRYQILAMTIWQCLIDGQPDTAMEAPFPSQSLSILKDMIRFIQRNYTDRVTLAQIAAAGNVSKSQCGILFRQHTSQTPMEYLNEYRLREAARLLLGTDKTVLQIALDTGFGGSSYFCEMFRRKHNQSPLQFRRLEGRRKLSAL